MISKFTEWFPENEYVNYSQILFSFYSEERDEFTNLSWNMLVEHPPVSLTFIESEDYLMSLKLKGVQ